MAENQKSNTPVSSPLGSTRQLLDELDSLMERMLALPVEDDGDEHSTAESNSATATEVMDEPSDVDKEPAESDSADDNEELEETGDETNYRFDETPSSLQPSAAEESNQVNLKSETLYGTVDHEAAPDLSHLKPSPVTAEIISPLLDRPKGILPEELVQRSPVLSQRAAWRNRWWVWPLSAMNRVFDFFTYALGPTGGWLRQPGGRTLLGLLGITLILAAIVIQIMMWLTWN